MKTTLLTLAGFLLSLHLSAQYLKGIVREKSGTPVANAQVIIKDVTFSKTVSTGGFELKLPADHIAGTRIVLDVQKEGMELVDEREIVTYVRRDPNDLVVVRMAPQGEKQRETARIRENLRQSIERSYKKKFEEQQQQYRQQQGLLADENSRLARERDQALQLVDELAKEMYRADLSGVDSTYRLAYNLFIEGKVEEAQAVVKKANLRKQLDDINLEERQAQIRAEERLKAKKQLAQTSALDAKMNISLLKFKEAEEAYELAVEADTTNYNIVFSFAFFLQKQNQFSKVQSNYERALTLAKDAKSKATILHNLGAFYTANQKMGEAEKNLTEALNIRRQLADKNPDAFLPDVAKTLNSLGNFYRDNQKMGEAEKAYTEALGIQRQLAAKNPNALLPDVSGTLNSLGIFYFANQKMPEAEKAYNEALSIQRQLAAKNPDAFLPNVATTLNNLSNFYFVNQKMPEAEKAYTEALSIQRQLAVKNPNAFQPDVANTLNNLGKFYSKNQKMPEAEKAYDEALSIRRQLAAKNPDAFLPNVATTLNNLGGFYSKNQKMPEAEKAYDEALSIRRQLAAKSPDAFLPDVATTLNDLGIVYCDNQKMSEAEKAYIEALSIRRQLAAKNPDAFRSKVASTLNGLGAFYYSNQKMSEAEKAFNETLSVQRQLAAKNPDAFLPDVAATLNNLGAVYYSNQKMSEAEKAYTEALSIRRQLAAKNPDAFQSDVATTLNNIGVFYRDSQKMLEAEKAHNEALSVQRQLAAKNPDAFLPDVAATLNNLGVFYKTLKNYSQALKHYEEALRLRQTAILGGQTHFFQEWVRVSRNINNIKDSTEAKKDYVNRVWAGRLMAESCDSLKGINEKLGPIASQEYASLSWWALFARDCPLAERAALRCLALDPEQLYIHTNLGHAHLLRGDITKAKEVYLHLKGKKDGGDKDYKIVLEEDFQALEAEGITHKGMGEIRRWLREEW